MSDEQRLWDFSFDPRFVVPLAALGVSPFSAFVRLDRWRLHVRFGPWAVDTPMSNVAGVEVTGPYRWWFAVGPRLSLSDGGATFGTTSRGGACLRFHEPVRALAPTDHVRHRGLTLTVRRPEAFAEVVDRLRAPAERSAARGP